MWRSTVRSVRAWSTALGQTTAAAVSSGSVVSFPRPQLQHVQYSSLLRKWNGWMPQSHQSFCRSLATQNASGTTIDGNAKGNNADEKELEQGIYPLPEGISNDRFGFFELLDSSKDMKEIVGQNAILSVHGPEEEWLPLGREAHGSSGGMFAIIATSGSQFKVMSGDVLYTNRIPGEVNSQHVFDSVMGVGTFLWSVIGRPLIRQARVIATIEEQTRSGKIHVYKFKKRKGYRRKWGHRQPITRFRINRIEFDLPDASKIQDFKIEYDPNRPPIPNHMRKL